MRLRNAEVVMRKAKIVAAFAMLVAWPALLVHGLSTPGWIESVFRVIDPTCRVLLMPQVCNKD